MFAPRIIIVPIDFSASSLEALRIADEMARDIPACQLHLLHVIPEPVCEAWAVQAPPVDATGLCRPWLEHARQRLEALSATLPIDRTRVTCAAIVGSPYAEISRYAAAHHADLIVMGSHGYGPVKRFLLGSVTEQVLHHASCRVLVVPHEAMCPSTVEMTPPDARASTESKERCRV
jgi:nucleotide-binding universal stress UspA family protein